VAHWPSAAEGRASMWRLYSADAATSQTEKLSSSQAEAGAARWLPWPLNTAKQQAATSATHA